MGREDRERRWQLPLVTGQAANALRVFCHGLHMALVFYGLFGWAIPSAPWLIAHLVFIPSLVVVWVANNGTCPLNNIETLLTAGRWRDTDNREEGSFLVTAVERYLGLHPTQVLMDRITYALMAFVWALSWLHLAILPG
jgi:hypothetical protein